MEDTNKNSIESKDVNESNEESEENEDRKKSIVDENTTNDVNNKRTSENENSGEGSLNNQETNKINNEEGNDENNINEKKFDPKEDEKINKKLDLDKTDEDDQPSELSAMVTIPSPSKTPLHQKIEYDDLYKYNTSKELISLSQPAQVLKEALLDRSSMMEILNVINSPYKSRILLERIDDEEIVKKLTFICTELILEENRSIVIDNLVSTEMLDIFFEHLDQESPLDNIRSTYFKMIINRFNILKRDALLDYMSKPKNGEQYSPARKLLLHCYNDNIFFATLKLLESEFPPSQLLKKEELPKEEPISTGSPIPPTKTQEEELKEAVIKGDQSPPFNKKTEEIPDPNKKTIKLPETPIQRRKSNQPVLLRPIFWSNFAGFVDTLFAIMDVTTKYETLEEITNFDLNFCDEASKLLTEALKRSNTHVILFRNIIIKSERLFWITLGLNESSNSSQKLFKRKFHKSVFSYGMRVLISVFAQVNRYFLPQKQQQALTSTVDQFIKYFPYFVTPLNAQNDTNTYGFVRLDIVKLVCLILRSKFYSTFESIFIQYQFVKIIIQHFFKYKNCNIFHTYFTEFGFIPLFRKETINTKMNLVKLVLNEYNLLNQIFEHFFDYNFQEEHENPKKNPIMNNCFNGHLFLIGNTLNNLYTVEPTLFSSSFCEFVEKKLFSLSLLQSNSNSNTKSQQARFQVSSLSPSNNVSQLTPVNQKVLSPKNLTPKQLSPSNPQTIELKPVNLQPIELKASPTQELKPVNSPVFLSAQNSNLKSVDSPIPIRLQPVNVVQTDSPIQINSVNSSTKFLSPTVINVQPVEIKSMNSSTSSPTIIQLQTVEVKPVNSPTNENKSLNSSPTIINVQPVEIKSMNSSKSSPTFIQLQTVEVKPVNSPTNENKSLNSSLNSSPTFINVRPVEIKSMNSSKSSPTVVRVQTMEVKPVNSPKNENKSLNSSLNYSPTIVHIQPVEIRSVNSSKSSPTVVRVQPVQVKPKSVNSPQVITTQSVEIKSINPPNQDDSNSHQGSTETVSSTVRVITIDTIPSDSLNNEKNKNFDTDSNQSGTSTETAQHLNNLRSNSDKEKVVNRSFGDNFESDSN